MEGNLLRILVVEDETDLARVLQRCLKEEGYAVDTVTDGEEALLYLDTVKYDTVILDLMLPGVDGLSLLRHLRHKPHFTPVLILTAKDTLDDKVRGLDSGADDYLTKPFALAELLARLRALLRRTEQQLDPVLRVADLELDTVRRRIVRGGQEIELTAREYALLEYLMRNQGRVLTRSQICEHVWDYDFDSISNVVDVYIRYLRRKVDDGFHPRLIHTVRGSGYRLQEPEEHAEASETPT